MESDIPMDFDTGKQTSSLEVSKNSRGYSWKIKVYNDDPDELMKQTQVLNEQCKARFKDEDN